MSSPSIAAVRHSDLDLPLVVTSLARGVVEQDAHPLVWRHLLGLRPQVRDHVAVLGLELVVDEVEGYAFLRSRPDEELDAERTGQPPLPRLIRRHALTYHVSLLLALLRRRMAEFDATSSDARLVLSREQIVDMVRVFLAASSNEARAVDQVDAMIARVVELGFLRRLPGDPVRLEVRRLLKAFVDAQWLADFDTRLKAYAHGPDALPSEQDAR